MKVLHLATFLSGGAGRAAYRLHEALLEGGVDSKMLFIQSLPGTSLPGCYSVFPLSFSDRIKIKLRKSLGQSSLEKQARALGSTINAETVMLPFSKFDILKHPLVEAADILHLHWIGGMVDYGSFFSRCKKNIVWTLHDMNPFMGLFAYRHDEEANKGIAKTDAAVKAFKKQCYAELKAGMQVICPSAWMREEAAHSDLMGNFTISEIPYTINSSKPQSKMQCRAALNMRSGEIVLLFVSMDVSNYRKGFDLLKAALIMLSKTNLGIHLVIIGDNTEKINIENIRISLAGKLQDETSLGKYYAACDAMILPSREDNLPNVMLEAFAHGIPVVGFRTGGIGQYVCDGETGYLADNVSAEALKNALLKLVERRPPFNAPAIRQMAEENFNKKKIAGSYNAIYNSIHEKAIIS